MNRRNRSDRSHYVLAVLAVLSLAAAGCGGGGTTVIVQGGGTPGGGTGPATVAGQGFKGPFQQGAQVQAFAVTNGVKGGLLGAASTDLSGNFSLTLTDATYSGPLILEITGSFFDEATGQIQQTGSTPLRGAVSQVSPGQAVSNVRVTPLTHLAVALATARGDLTETGLTTALAEIGTRFSVANPGTAAPLDARRSATGVDANSVDYGLAIAGISQVAESADVPTMTLLEAAALDISDGSLDGASGGNPIPMRTNGGSVVQYDAATLTTTLATAIGTFVDSPQDGTELTSTDPVVTSLQVTVANPPPPPSGNQPPVARIAVSQSTVVTSTTVLLDGRGSSDPESGALTYVWTVVLGGQIVSVSNAGSAQASFVALQAGTYLVGLTVRDAGGLTGATSIQIIATEVPPVAPAAFSIGELQAPAFVAQGQTFVATLPIGNTGDRTANVASASLAFPGTSLVVSARTGNPAQIAAGQTGSFTFDVTVPDTAATGTFTANAQVSGTDAVSGQAISASRTGFASLTVLAEGTAVPLSVGTAAPVSPITKGQTATLSLPVTNLSTEAANLLGASLGFSDPNILASFSPASPPSIAGGATANLIFTVLVGPSTPAGTHVFSASVQGRSAIQGTVVDGSRASAGSITVIDTARLRVQDLILSQSVVSQGATVSATFTLQSVGGSSANLTTVALQLGGVSFAPLNLPIPSTLAPGQQAVFLFSVDTDLVPVGTHSANGLVAGTDAATGAAVPVIQVSPPPTLTVQSPAQLAITAFTPPTAVLSHGQSITATVAVKNSGTASSSPTNVTLQFFQGSANVSAFFNVSASASNPVTVAGNATATYSFVVTALSGGPTGDVDVRATATGRDVNSGASLVPSPATVRWTVQRPANVSLGATTAPSFVIRGETFSAVKSVTNLGDASLLNVQAQLTFATSGLTVVSSSGPATIAGGQTVSYSFDVRADAGATPGSRQVGFTLTGTEANTAQGVTATRDPDFSIAIQTPPNLAAQPMLAPTTVSLGQTFLATVPVTNSGQAVAMIDSSSLQFSGTGFTVTPVTIPATIAGQSSALFVFSVSVSLGAELTQRTATFGATATDLNGSSSLSLENVFVGTVTVLSPGTLVIADITQPATVSQGQSFVVTVQLRNTGQASVENATGTLTLSGDGVTVVSRQNPSTLAGGQIIQLLFDVAVSPTATPGPRTAGVTVTAEEAGTGAPLSSSRPNAGTITVQTPPVLVVGSIAGPVLASQGQTKRVTALVTNAGQATALVDSATLTFDNALNLSVTLAGSPSTIPGGTSGLVTFDIVVGSTATPGNRSMSIDVTARDGNSFADVSASNGSAGILTLQTPASLTVGSMIAPATVSLGQMFSATIPVTNSGQSAATVTTALVQFTGSGISVTPVNVPSSIPGLSTAQMTFRVFVALGSELTARTANFTMVASDASSGANLSVSNVNVGSVTVQSPGQIAIADILEPATVSQGQTFVVTVQAQNTGQAAAVSVTADLTLSGDGLTLTPRAGNPTTIGGGAIESFLFDVTVSPTATPGSRIASVTVAGLESGTLAPLAETRSNAGTISVQTPASLSVSNIGGQLVASLGQTIAVTVTVTNSGQAAARIEGAVLSFTGSTGLSVSLVAPPASVAGGASADLRFDVIVSGSATPGTRAAAVTVTAADANSGVDVSASNAAAGSITLQAPASLTAGQMISPSTASLGQSFRVTVPVSNTGQATATVSTAALSFSGNGLSVTPVTVPPSIGGLSTANLVFDVTVALGSELTARTAFLTLFGADVNSGVGISISGANVGTVTVQSPGILAIAGFSQPSTATQGQSFSVTIGVQNTGQSTIQNIGAALTFSGSDLTVTTSSAPGSIGGGQIVNYVFDVTVGASAASGPRTASFSIDGTEAGTGDPVSATAPSAGTVTIQTPASLAMGSVTIPATVSRGQVFFVTVPLTNSGEADATLQAESLSFQVADGLAVSVQSAPAEIPGNGSGDVIFSVTVGTSAALSTRTASVIITAADANTGADVSVSNANAGSMTVQTAANLDTITAFLIPSSVSRGQTFFVTATLTNTGQATASITTIALDFDDPSGLTIVPFANPSQISGLANGSFSFQVDVSGSAAATTRNAQLSIFASDANSGQNLSALRTGVGSVTIQTPAALSFTGGLSAPATVSQGQSFTANFTVQNTGQSSASITTVSLSFSGADLTVTPQSTTATVAGGDSRSFTFDVIVGGSAAVGARTAAGVVTATEVNSGNDISISNAALGSVTVQTPANVSTISDILGQTTLTRGQSVTISVVVTNTGEATANVSDVDLSFSDNGNITVTPIAGPATLAGSGSGTYTFTVAVADTATPGTRTAIVAVTATDANSGNDVSSTDISAGTLTIQTPPSLGITSITGPATANRGQTGLTIQMTVQNTGQASAQLTTASIAFGTSGMTSSLLSSLSSPLAGGASVTLDFDVDVSGSATLGSSTITGNVSGLDVNSGSTVSASGPATGSLTVQKQAALLSGDVTVSAPATIDRAGATVNVTLSVTNGDTDTASVLLSAGTTLSFSTGSAGYSVVATGDLFTRTIAGGATESFVFTVGATSQAQKFTSVIITGTAFATDQNDGTISSQAGTDTWIVREAASDAKGQADFNSGDPDRGGSAGANTLDTPLDVATDGTQLAIADTGNSRIVIYTSLAATSASKVFGQANFTSTTTGTTAGTLNLPEGVHISGSDLVVADTQNHRVLIYRGFASLASGSDATVVIGQADFTSGDPDGGVGPSALTLDTPTDVFVDTASDKLVVADSGNHRVLIYDTFSALSSGAAASVVIGQINATDSSENQGGSAGLDTLKNPSSVAVESNRLVVADTDNHRVLIYAGFSTLADGDPASGVLGQTSGTGTAADGGSTTNDAGLNFPTGVALSGGKLFISDSVNHRIVIHGSFSSTAAGESADDLLGQALFTQNTSNNVGGTLTPDEYSLQSPQRGVASGSNRLFVADQLNHRVLRFPIP